MLTARSCSQSTLGVGGDDRVDGGGGVEPDVDGSGAAGAEADLDGLRGAEPAESDHVVEAGAAASRRVPEFSQGSQCEPVGSSDPEGRVTLGFEAEDSRIMAAFGTAHRSLLDDAVPDIERLVEFHEKETGTARGRRRPDIQVVSRSAVVLICASWEAFCEDLAAEALRHLADHAPKGASLPKEIKKTLKKSLLDEKNELAIWDLADDGWRTALRARAKLLTDDDDRSLNTPKPRQVKDFFDQNVGIADITAAWLWHKNDQQRTTQLLNDFVVLRGAIAHRRSPAGGVRKKKATDGLDLVLRLAEKSAECVSDHLLKHTGVALPELDPPTT